MECRKLPAQVVLQFSAILLIILWLASASWAASEYAMLHAFGGSGDGSEVNGSVVLDKKGNLYGTTLGGGTNKYGTVFKLTHKPCGQWTERLLHSFDYQDGVNPMSGLVLDSAGAVYGTTSLGGAHHSGTVFEMTSAAGWIPNVLYSFCAQPGCSDGGSPEAGLALDGTGNLYGASNVVFELSPGTDPWTEQVLYTFCSEPGCIDGSATYAGLIRDARGNLYGTTLSGGAHQYGGTVFKLRLMPDGSWKHSGLDPWAETIS